MNSKSTQLFLKKISTIQDKLFLIWEKGRDETCLSNDGHHWRMRGFWRPISISLIESYILFNLVITLNVKKAFEIGTGFGYSSFWIASAIYMLHGKNGWFRSLDNYSEGKMGKIGLQFALENSKFLGIDLIIKYCIGDSPLNIKKTIGRKKIDLIFIDGNHHGDQPVEDVKGVLRNTDNNSVILFHDINSRYNVQVAIDHLIGLGWKFMIFPTSCNLGICYKKNEDKIQKAFKNASQKILLNE
jgi:hypothetical protein